MTDNVFIIAEAGVNHNGDLEAAIELVNVASECGADAVKFQTFKTDRLTTKRAATCDYQEKATDGLQSQQDMLRKLELTENEFILLAKHCQNKNIEFMSTGFDIESLDFLIRETKIKRIKIPSGEMVNPFLLLHAARSGLPIILSTGMADINEIKLSLGVLVYGLLNQSGIPTQKEAITLCQTDEGLEAIRTSITILHCTSEYPAPMNEVNLRAMNGIADIFNTQIGFSDHTEGVSASIGAAALGAHVIEKHFTLDKSLPGPDHKASLSPNELKQLVEGIRDIEKALGTANKEPTNKESNNKTAIRGSLVAKTNISEGDVFTEENLTVKRPGDGLHPMSYLDLNGKVATKNYKIDSQIG